MCVFWGVYYFVFVKVVHDPYVRRANLNRFCNLCRYLICNKLKLKTYPWFDFNSRCSSKPFSAIQSLMRAALFEYCMSNYDGFLAVESHRSDHISKHPPRKDANTVGWLRKIGPTLLPPLLESFVLRRSERNASAIERNFPIERFA